MQPNDSKLVAAREERMRLAVRLQQLETDYALGNITGQQLQKATATVDDELAQADVRLTSALRHSTSSSVLGAANPDQASSTPRSTFSARSSQP